MAAKKKRAGGSLTRSQVVTVRLDPKLKYAAELAARQQRRTVSSFIEWAVEEAVKRVRVRNSDSRNIEFVTAKTWDVEEADRLVKLAINCPELLTFDEERMWKIISEHPYFWDRDWSRQDGPWEIAESWILWARVREQWTTLNKIIEGEKTIKDLPAAEEVPF